MIQYKFPEEKDFILYYAKRLNDITTKEIIHRGKAENSTEAKHLAKFFWEMVDQCVKDKE